jgi:hypothetical protein
VFIFSRKTRKLKKAYDKAVIANVTEEMVQPRLAESAKIKTDTHIGARDGKPA